MNAAEDLEGGIGYVQAVEGDESLSGESAVIQAQYRQGPATIVSTKAVTPENDPPETPRRSPQPDLLFVTYTGPSGIASRDLKHVRSHVMHQHLRRRRTRTDEESTGTTHATAAKRPRINLLLEPGAGRADPFGTLSVIMTRAMSRLFDHYATTLSPLHYPPCRDPLRNPMTTRWVPMAIRDPALLHSTICSAAGHLALLEGHSGPKSSEYLTHKTETIRIVNGRMNDASQAMTDETLGAIALLVTDQVVEGDYKEMAVHMRGLAKLVGLRGGLVALGMNGVLAGEIQWCDIVTAFMTSSPPLIPLQGTADGLKAEFSSPRLRRFFSPDLSTQSLPAVLNDSSLSEILSPDLIETYKDTNTLTAILNLKADFSEADMLVYDRKRAAIQHRLASMRIPSLSAKEDGSQPLVQGKIYIQESCRMAGILYSNMTLWGFQPPMHFYGDLAIMLQQALLHTDLESDWKRGVLKDILLWILCLGGYAALNRAERAWFVELLGNMGKERRFRGLKDLKVVLNRVSYQDSLEKPLEALWKEVEVFMQQGNRRVSTE